MDIIFKEKEKRVFDALADKQSKEVFIKRKVFAEKTGANFSYIDRTYNFIDVFDKPNGFDETVELLRSRPYVLYGFGFRGNNILDVLKLCGCKENCVGIWDNNPEFNGTVFEGIKISLPLPSVALEENLLIVISVSERLPSFKEIRKELAICGIPDKNIVCPYYVFYNFKNMYFDEDIILTRLEKDEIFIDGGCCDFFTSKQLLGFHPNLKKIYAVEPDLSHHEEIMRGISESCLDKAVLVKCALWSKRDTLNFTTEMSKSLPGSSHMTTEQTNIAVTAMALDEIVQKTEKITFIKLDVEGSEMEALLGAKNIIKRDKPKLAVCIYHRPNDYYEIPTYIKSLVPEYQLFMRQYKPFCDDTVLYAVL